MRVTAEAKRAIAVIRRCVESDHYALTLHFAQRMQQRGLFWPDAQAIIEDPREVRPQGLDSFDRPKWIIRGEAVGAGEIEIVCAIESDESGTEFLTIYWED